jgi:hypothetical protein
VRIGVAAERAGTDALIALADPAAATARSRRRRNQVVEFLLDPCRVDAEVVEDAAGGRTGVQVEHEQQVLGTGQVLTAVGGESSGAGHHRGLGPAVPDIAGSGFVAAGRFEPARSCLSDLVAGYAVTSRGGSPGQDHRDGGKVVGAGFVNG